MVRIVLLSIFIVLSGCKNTHNEKLTSKKIGILIPEPQQSRFCYKASGLLTSQNKHMIAELNPYFTASFKRAVNISINKSGNIPIYLDSFAFDNDYFELDSYGRSINKKGKEYIRSLPKLKDVDYIVFPSQHPTREPCMVRTQLGYSDSHYRMSSNIKLNLINTQTLKVVHSTRVSS